MKNLMLMVLVLSMGVVAVGCAAKKANDAAVNDSVTDINVAPIPPKEPQVAFADPAPEAATPVYAEPAVTQTPPTTPAPAGGAGGSYTVKKGDTLFSIAKQNYGNGNQWQKIVQANPGLSPSTLKAGKTIVLP
jgi:nucleoid-associated protein YgaU